MPWREAAGRWARSSLAHRRNRAVISAAFKACGLAGPAEDVLVGDAVLTPAGMALHVAVPLGQSIASVAAKADALAAALRVSSVHVAAVEPGVLRLELRERDPLVSDPAPTWPLEDPSFGVVARHTLASPVPVAFDDYGASVYLDVWASSVLVGGQPGAGKSSSALWPLTLAAAFDPFAQLFVIDAKGGIELAPLARAGRTSSFVTRQPEAVELLDALLAEVLRRQEVLLDLGARKVLPGSRDLPPLVLVVDELAEVTATGSAHDKTAALLLRRLLSVGRATGLTVFAATQKPSSDVVPTAARDLFRYRWCLRVGSRTNAVVVLGDDPVANGAAPHTIPPGPEHAGVGYVCDEEGVVRRCRGYYVSDTTAARLSARSSVWYRSSGVRVSLGLTG